MVASVGTENPTIVVVIAAEVDAGNAKDKDVAEVDGAAAAVGFNAEAAMIIVFLHIRHCFDMKIT